MSGYSIISDISVDEIVGTYDRCPICDADQKIKQPEPSLHAFTLIYECGTEVDYPLGQVGASFGVSCDGKVKRDS